MDPLDAARVQRSFVDVSQSQRKAIPAPPGLADRVAAGLPRLGAL